MRFIDVYDSSDAPELLYQLLEERSPEINISHRELPDWRAHIGFIDSRPYEAWYVIEIEGRKVGAIYLSRMNEIGVFILTDSRGKGYGKIAIQMLMEQHPRERYFANINPANGRSIQFFKSLGFQHIQNTYEKH